MGNCSQLCQHKPMQASGLPLTQPNIVDLKTNKAGDYPSEIIAIAEQFTLKCQICGQQRSHTKLKSHMDLCHFVDIHQKEGKSSDLQIVCLLCNFKSHSLQQHKLHMRSAHEYMNQQSTKNMQQQQLNQLLQTNLAVKKRVKPITKGQFAFYPDEKTAMIFNEQYQVETFEKEYGAMQFNEQTAQSDVVWRYVFGDLRNAQFYYLQFVAKQRSILAKSRIFTKKRNL